MLSTLFDHIRTGDAIVAWMLTYLLHSTLLLALAGLANRLLPRAQLAARETLWKTALLGGVLTATLQVGLAIEPLTGAWSMASRGAEPALLSGAERADPTPTDQRAPTASRTTEATTGSVVSTVESSTARPVRRLAQSPVNNPGVSSPAGRTEPMLSASWRSWIGAIWLLGGALLLARLGLFHLRFHRLLAGRRELRDGRLRRILDALVESLPRRRAVRLTSSARITVPLARGVRRREICFPDRAMTELAPERQELVLAHELAHLERRDPIWQLATRVLETVLFFQPLNHLARRRLQEIAEYRCDDWAVELTGRPVSMARCLTEVAEWGLAGRSGLPTPAMAVERSRLGRRVRRLLDRSYPAPPGVPPAWLRPAAVATLALTAFIAPAVTGARPAEPSGGVTDAGKVPAALTVDAVRPVTPAKAAAPAARSTPPAARTTELLGSLPAEPVLAPSITRSVTPVVAPLATLESALAGSPTPVVAPAPVVASAPAVAPAPAAALAPVVTPAPAVAPSPAAAPSPATVPRPVVSNRPALTPAVAPTPAADSPAAISAPVAPSPIERAALASELQIELATEVALNGVEIADIALSGIELSGIELAGTRMAALGTEIAVEALPLAVLARVAADTERSSEQILHVHAEIAAEAEEIARLHAQHLGQAEAEALAEIEAMSARLEEISRPDAEALARLEQLAAEMAERHRPDEEDLARLEELAQRIAERSQPDPAALARLEEIAARTAEARLDPEAIARLEELATRLAENGDVSAEERAALHEEARRIAQEARPSPEELAELHAEARRISEQARPSAEELAELREEAQRIAEQARPSAEERARLHEEARRIALEALPSPEELERLREELRAERESYRAERQRHLEEMRREHEQKRRRESETADQPPSAR